MHRFHRVDNPLRDHVASHDSAKNVYQDRFHVFVRDQNLERFGHLLFGRAAADIEKVGRAAAVKLDDVHRRHGQTGAVHQTGDVSVETDIIETVL